MSFDTSISDEIFEYAKEMGFGEIHFKMDPQTGLFAIIAIHSTKLGPALGGCRFREYESVNHAIYDVLRLAQGMSYKAAVTGLPLGGGKSVIIQPKNLKNREALFEKFGEFIDELGGRYITAMDSGTHTTDMDCIAKKTRYVTSTSTGNGDPSPYTAEGVFLSIKAAVKAKLGRDDLNGLKVAMQGVGHVGMPLAQHLHDAGAELIITDTNEAAIKKCVELYQAKAVDLDEIYGVDCDIFSPCALGATINDQTIPQLKAKIIVGSANNQLAEARHGDELHKRGILYGPDYVVNAGGLVCASAQYYKTPKDVIKKQVAHIYDATMAIFERSEKRNRPTYIVADNIAKEKLAGETHADLSTTE